MDGDFSPRVPLESMPELEEESAHPARPFPAPSGLESDPPLVIDHSHVYFERAGETSWCCS